MTRPTPTAAVSQGESGGQTYRLEMPDNVAQRFDALADGLGALEASMGQIVDEWIVEVPYKYVMAAYAMFADRYWMRTGRRISPETVRHWREQHITFTKHDIETFNVLTPAQRIESVKLADELKSLDVSDKAKLTPAEICQYCVDNTIGDIPAMRAELLPPTFTNYDRDPGWLSALKRTVNKYIPADDPEYQYVMLRVNEIADALKKKIFRG